MKAKLRWRLVPLYFAAAFFAIPAIESSWNHRQVSLAAEVAQTKIQSAINSRPALIEGVPSRIIVQKLAIDLPVVKGSYDNHTKDWSVAPGMANYAVNTVPLNNRGGQTLVYGHNNRAVFGPLLNLRKGDLVYVYTANGHIFKYSFTGSQNLDPKDTAIFSSMRQSGPGLRLITCTGSQFEYRHFMAFRLLQAT